MKGCMKEQVLRSKIMKTTTCPNNLGEKKRKVIQNAHGSCHREVPKEALRAHIHILPTILGPREIYMYYFHLLKFLTSIRVGTKIINGKA